MLCVHTHAHHIPHAFLPCSVACSYFLQPLRLFSKTEKTPGDAATRSVGSSPIRSRSGPPQPRFHIRQCEVIAVLKQGGSTSCHTARCLGQICFALGRFRPPAATWARRGSCRGHTWDLTFDISSREYDFSWQLGWAGYTNVA